MCGVGGGVGSTRVRQDGVVVRYRKCLSKHRVVTWELPAEEIRELKAKARKLLALEAQAQSFVSLALDAEVAPRRS